MRRKLLAALEVVVASTWENELKTLATNLESEFGVVLELISYGERGDTAGAFEISSIVVPKEHRKEGVGGKVMQRVIDFADDRNLIIGLTPSKDFGATSINRLRNFYGKHGFVRNLGRNKDFLFRDAMIRRPKTPKVVGEEKPTLESFYAKHGIDPEEMGYLGKGENGEAYLVGDGRVLKISSSETEFKYALEITKGNYPDFATILDTAEIDRAYYILQEELEQEEKDEYLFYEVSSLLDTQGLHTPYIGHFDEDDYVEEHGKIDPDVLKFMNELDSVATDYRRLGIEAPDIQPDNLGRDKKGKLKAFDIDTKRR